MKQLGDERLRLRGCWVVTITVTITITITTTTTLTTTMRCAGAAVQPWISACEQYRGQGDGMQLC
jgi:carbohydrate-binding DOMON domain-containing protein